MFFRIIVLRFVLEFVIFRCYDSRELVANWTDVAAIVTGISV